MDVRTSTEGGCQSPLSFLAEDELIYINPPQEILLCLVCAFPPPLPSCPPSPLHPLTRVSAKAKLCNKVHNLRCGNALTHYTGYSLGQRRGEGRGRGEATGNVVNSTPPESRKWRRCRPGDPIPMFTVYSRERGARSRGESRTWKSEYTSSVGEELYWRCRSTIMHRGESRRDNISWEWRGTM